MRKNDERAEQVVKAWLEDGTISKEFLSGLVKTAPSKVETITLFPSKKFVTPKIVYPGMFCYSTEDHLIYPEIIPELAESLCSVVSYVTKTEIFSLCRKQKRLPWSSVYLHVEMPKGLSGRENTKLILGAANKRNKKAEAAQYCQNYCQNGVKKGSAFLFSKDEQREAYLSCEKANQSFSALGEELLPDSLWSSSEYSYNSAWKQDFSNGNLDNYCKDNFSYVRPGLSHKR